MWAACLQRRQLYLWMLRLPPQDPGALASFISFHRVREKSKTWLFQHLLLYLPQLLLESSKKANYPVWTFPTLHSAWPRADTLKQQLIIITLILSSSQVKMRREFPILRPLTVKHVLHPLPPQCVPWCVSMQGSLWHQIPSTERHNALTGSKPRVDLLA